MTDKDLSVTQDNKKEPQPKKNRLTFGLGIAKVLATTASFGIGLTTTIIKALHGDLSNVGKAVKAAISLTFKASALTVPIKVFKEKQKQVIDKLKSTKVGNAIVKGFSTIWKTLTSKPVKRAYKTSMAILALASAPTPIGAVIGTMALVIVTYGIVKECLEVRSAKRLGLEKSLLEQNKVGIIQQKQLMQDKQLAINSPDLQIFLQNRIDALTGPTTILPLPKKVSSKTIELLRTLRDNVLEGSSAILESLDGNPVTQALSAISIFGGVTGEAAGRLDNRAKKKKIVEEINELKPYSNSYKNLTALRELTRQQKIDQETLNRFLADPHINNLNHEELNHKFSTISQKINQESEFIAPPKKNLLQKFISSVKTGFSYFKKSQIQGVIDLYKKPKITIIDSQNANITSTSPTIQQSIEKPPNHIKDIPEKDWSAVKIVHDKLIKNHLIDIKGPVETAPVHHMNPQSNELKR